VGQFNLLWKTVLAAPGMALEFNALFQIAD
jgi:hypothetical protein